MMMILYYFAVHSQRRCQAPPVLLPHPTGDKIIHPDCVWYSGCSNDLATGVPINAINCSIPDSTVSGNCHLWGSDGPHQQMLLVYLLRITSNTMTLHYFNDSSSSQQKPSITKQQLCTANNNFDIAKMINESCMSEEILPGVIPNQDSVCCTNFNISIDFNDGRMEIHSLNGFIEIPVDY